MMKKILIFSLALFSVVTLFGQVLTPTMEISNDGRQLFNINAGWHYSEDNSPDIEAIQNQQDWAAIDLPHTWNQWDVMDTRPGYRRDASWYRKTLNLNVEGSTGYFLYFEGANISTEVFVNGKYAGGHIGGYVGFEVDLSPHLRSGENEIYIRVDNGYNPSVIPSQKADFFIYGGITRDLWLKVVPKLHLGSVLVSTPVVTEEKAETQVRISLEDMEGGNQQALLKCQLFDQKNNLVGTNEVKATGKSTVLNLPEIKNPELWSPASPALYSLKTQLVIDGQVTDEVEETIGYRWYKFEPYGAFFLNGKQLLLRGTHRHEEHAGLGAAMPNELHRQDIQMMKDLGVNFLRLGHYPQDPEIYKACNELGIVVWDELPWCRGGMGGQNWQDNTQRLLREQITQNYNHPSIFFWSLGNEIYWLPDFEDGDNELALNAFLTKLNSLAHELDANRPTAIRKYYAGADLVDVFSPSIWSGWYAGAYTNYASTLTKNQAKYKQFLHMEYGGSSHVGRHTESPITGAGSVNDDDWAEVANQVNVKNIAKDGDWTESYIVDLFDHYLSVTETQPNFAGNAQWAFKDFGTPLRPENAIPYLNQKGLVDRNGKPKDAYYVFKSYWSDDPFAYIESHTWTHRRGPKGKKRNVPVYSNADRVELIHNGVSLGAKTRKVGLLPAGGLHWDIDFREGANHFEALAFTAGKQVAIDTLTVFYDFKQPANPDRVELSYEKLENGNFLIEAVMVDKNGDRVYDYKKRMYFTLNGNGALLENYGTPTRSSIIEMANGRAAIEMTPGETGQATIEARNQDFKGSYLVVPFGAVRR